MSLIPPRNLRDIYHKCCEHCRWIDFYYKSSDTHKCRRPGGPEFNVDYDPAGPYYKVCDLFEERKASHD